MKIIFTIICLFLYLHSFSQTYNYHHYDLSKGLSGLTVYKMLEDKEGFIWFATETGLSRFDGTSFKNFSTADGLPDNEILDLYYDSMGRLWILPFTNSICYYKNGKIYNQKNDSFLSKINLKGPPYTIVEGANNSFLIIEHIGFTHISSKGVIKRYDSLSKSVLATFAIGISEKEKFKIPIALNDPEMRVSLIEVNDSSIKELEILPLINNTIANKTTIIYTKRFFISSSKDSALIFSYENNELTKFQTPNHFIGLSLLKDSLVAFNCSDRLLIYNINSKTFKDTVITGKIVTSSFIDSENSLWIATNGYGVYRLTTTAAINYELVFDNNALPVYSFCKNGTDLLIGTNTGLVWSLNMFQKKLSIKNKIFQFGEARVTGISKAGKGLLVCSSSVPAVTYFSNRESQILLSSASIKSIYAEGNEVLLSSIVGLYSLDISSLKVNFYSFRKNRSTSAIKYKGNYYIGTLHGVYYLSGDKKDSGYLDNQELVSSRISAFAKTAESLLIATYGNGIIEFRDGKVLNHYTEKNGLTSNMCRDLSIDRNWLWVGTDKGLNKINLNNPKGKIVTYTTKDGLNTDLINKVLAVNDSVFIGTAAGMIFFRPNEVDNYSVSRLYVETIKSRKNTWSFDSTLNFAANDNRFYVEYGAISFKSNGNITFNYRLNGLDSNWKETKERFIDYASLPPGDYQFQLYAINAFGKKSNEVKINFSIDSYFYQKAWFIILVLLSAGSIIWYFVSRRIRKIKAEETAKLKTQKRLTELEQLAFRAQMNPHFIFNCLNSIQQYIFTKSALEANKFITDFSSLIRQTLDLSTKKYISLAEEVKYISTYLSLEHTRFDKSFDYSINLANQLNTEEIFLPPLLMQPFVENAIRHGVRNLKETDGLITVDFSAEGDFLVYTLSDNGIGIEESLKLRGKNIIEHQSKGMTLIQKRIEALNEELSKKIELRISYVDEIHKKGTKIILRLPLYI